MLVLVKIPYGLVFRGQSCIPKTMSVSNIMRYMWLQAGVTSVQYMCAQIELGGGGGGGYKIMNFYDNK